jgi:hypothetical protein
LPTPAQKKALTKAELAAQRKKAAEEKKEQKRLEAAEKKKEKELAKYVKAVGEHNLTQTGKRQRNNT